MAQKLMKKMLLTIGFVSVVVAPSMANVVDGPLLLNEISPIGTIALVPKAIRSSQIGRINRFRIVDEESRIELIGQRGYCFIATHFDPDLAGQTLSYEFRMTQYVDGEKVVIDPGSEKTLAVTNNNASTRFPSYCIFARPAGTQLSINAHFKVAGQTIERRFTIIFG